MNALIALSLAWLAHFLVDFMIGVWSVFKTINGLDIGLAGLIAGSCGLIGEGSQLFFGHMTDRGFRKILIVVGLLLSIASAFLAESNSYLIFFLLYLTACLGSGAFHPPAVALVGSLTASRKGLYICIFATGGSLGLAISQIVFAKAHSYFDGSTLVLLIPSCILALICLSVGYGRREQHEAPKTRVPFGLDSIKSYFRNASLRNLYFSQVCSQTLSWGTIFILPDILASRGYAEEIVFGGGHMVFILGGVLMMIPSGYLADRYSAKAVILTAGALGMILFATFLTMPFLPVIYLLPLLGALGAMMGLIQPVAVALGNKLSSSNPGLVSAFTMGLVWCVSEMVGPGGVGLLTKLYSEDAPAQALLTMGLLFPVMIGFASLLPQVEKDAELATESLPL